MENLSTVTYGTPIKKYAQTTPSVDGVTSFFDIEIIPLRPAFCLISKETPQTWIIEYFAAVQSIEEPPILSEF
jgi:hypothetical protein